MRTMLPMLGFAIAISTSWHTSLATQAKASYTGPVSVSFKAHGVRAYTRNISVDLRTGAATIIGPCWPTADCGPSSQRNFILAPQDLAKFRSLAIEIKAEGLLDPVCIERQKKENILADQRDKEEWEKQHPELKGPPPVTLPHHPFNANFELQGVGTVMSSNFDPEKSNAHCVTRATKTLWDMVMHL